MQIMDRNLHNIYIYEDSQWSNLSPIVDNRPTFEIKCGAFSCLKRINILLPDAKIHLIVRNELVDITRENYPGYTVNPDEMLDGYWFLGNALWSRKTIQKIINSSSTRFISNKRLVGASLKKIDSEKWINNGGPLSNFNFDFGRAQEIKITLIDYLWDALRFSPNQIIEDSAYFNLGSLNGLMEKGKGINTDNIFIDETVELGYQNVVDASDGPVIIAEKTKIKPFCYLAGPLYIGPNCTIQPNSILKGGTVIGKHSSIGGEISQSIIHGFSNKSHYGYLGNSYLGSWINLGAGTTNSNLKNNYSEISMMINNATWNSKQLKLGCFIGDYTSTGINTKINTGTILGICSNIVSDTTVPKLIGPFTWLVDQKIMKYDLEKLLKTLEIVKNRRGKVLSNIESKLLKYIYNKSN